MYEFTYRVERNISQTVFIRSNELEKALAIFRENYDNEIIMVVLKEGVDIIN